MSTAASLLAVAPGLSFALGLGDIQLRSTLNAPLNAEIELIATAEELASLRTQIASRDSFSRYGLDYPAFLASIQVRPVRLADGRTIIQLTSTVPMTEPFATLLVEASWARGRNLREYTVLFDPPAFAPGAAAAAPIAAPVTGGGERSGAITRPVAPVAPVAPSTPAAAPAPAPAPAPVRAGGEYVVRGGDSLSAIARNQFGGAETERAMIAIYRGNSSAFDGNINRLRAGSVLRLPDNAALAAIDPNEAAGEVRRQVASWSRGASQAAAPAVAADPRLRLVPPAAPGATGNSAETQALRDRVSSLESELSESRRLLALRNAELARLQQSAASPPAAPTPEPAPVAETAPPPPAPVAQTPEPAPTEPVVEAPVKPAPVVKSAAKPVAAESGTSLFDTLKAFWFVPVGLLVLLLGALGLRAARRRRDESSESLAPFAVAASSQRDPSSDTFPLRRPIDSDDRSILVEESGTHERPTFTRKDTRTVDLDDGTASMVVPALDATAALEQGDPLAEADFHMAYGLYDQAADLVKLAIQREPNRRDLKLKLLEVFFVWGNKDQFLQTARELADTRDDSAPGEWEKVVIMGKQLAPEDALFSQSYSGVGPSSVDLNLEGGQNLIDFDLDGEPSVSMNRDGGIDMNLGGASRGNEATNVDGLSGLGGLDFMLDDASRGDDLARTATTRQMVQPGFGGHEESPTQRFSIDGPTVEQPALDDDVGDTLVGKLDAQVSFAGPDQTAELAIDDLGLDLGKFDQTGTNLLDDSRLARALEASDAADDADESDGADAPTLVAGMDETSRRLIEEATYGNQPTELLPLTDLDIDGGVTARVSVLDLEFDVDSNAETGKRNALSDAEFNLDLDVGAPEQAVDGEYQRTQRIDPVSLSEADPTVRDLEPVTMSEVGTKLDLARAYMDMGDPDGARSILREVLQEGSTGQRQEAQRLIDSIPG
ncbi:MAG: FimV/HubP family polar landmark protein [Steroidobacteraceae bacterium]